MRHATRTRRWWMLLAGLVTFALSMAMLLRSDLGAAPWDVLHQGLARSVGATVGTWLVIGGVCCLLLWLPLHNRPGPATLASVAIVGPLVDAFGAMLPHATATVPRVGYFVSGTVLNAGATVLYLSADLGAAPRDGVMVGLARSGIPIHVARLSIEGTVLACGWLLGGTAGFGTAAYALAIGPLIRIFMPRQRADGPPASHWPPRSPARVRLR